MKNSFFDISRQWALRLLAFRFPSFGSTHPEGIQYVMEINKLKDQWITEGRLTLDARELFYIAGREIEDIPLSDAAATMDSWLNEPDSDRWRLAGVENSLLIEIEQVATKLGMLSAWPRSETEPTTDMIVVLPSEYHEMSASMWYALKEMRGVNHLLMLASLRQATEAEIDILGHHRLVPGLSIQATEATMAQLALTKAVFEVNTQMRGVLAVGSSDGKPATLEQMMTKFISTIEPGDITFVITQPAAHKALVVERILQDHGFEGTANYIAASPVRPIDVNHVGRILDEGCRMVLALAKLERIIA